MLRCRLALDDLGGPWRWSGGRYTAAGSWVEPYAHPVLEHHMVTDGHSLFVTVRERQRASEIELPAGIVDPDTYQRRLLAAKSWPLDWIVVEISGRRVCLSTGVWGTAPVYLVPAGAVLHGSWDLMDLHRHLRTDDLVAVEVARLLTYWRRYSASTLWRGAAMLTERATACFSDGGLAMIYPEAAEHSRARELRNGADPIAVFEALLATGVGRRLFDPATTAVEISGGLDSTNVAMGLAARHPGALMSCAMMIGGPEGVQQRRRRAEVVERGGFQDVTVDGLAYPPLCPGGARSAGQPVYPDEESFAEATTAMLAGLAARGVRVAFTGIGGDELLALREWEREHPLDRDAMTFPPWLTRNTVDALMAGEEEIAPASVITEVTLMSFACRWPLYLRAGIWPVSPLAAPELITFAEWLPARWRRRKRLLRERLSRLGFPDEVVSPRLRENLSGIMGRGLRRYGLPMLRTMLEDSLILADLGYVDPGRLRVACDQADAVREAEIDRRLFPVIATELVLRGKAGTVQ